MKKLYIVILNFHAPQALAACLKSLEAVKIPAGWQKVVLVIDNNQNNRGFSAGCNLGIRQALKHKADAVLLLNQDAEVSQNFLMALIKNPADIVAPVIKFRRCDRWIYDFGGKINWWLGRASHWESLKVQGFKSLKIDYVSGCAMLIRLPVLEKIGLLDEGYFLYFEDVDFCLRANKAGFKITVEPKSQIIHRLAEKKSPASRRCLIRSHWRFINCWCRWPSKILAYFYWLLVSVKISWV